MEAVPGCVVAATQAGAGVVAEVGVEAMAGAASVAHRPLLEAAVHDAAHLASKAEPAN